MVFRMKRRPKLLILLASFFIFYVPLFFGLFQCYCLSEADLFASPAFEGPDLLSMPSGSLGNNKFFVLLSSLHDSLFIPDSTAFRRLLIIPSQICYLEVKPRILRC